MNRDLTAIHRGEAAERLRLNGDWAIFMDWIREQMDSITAEAMLTANNDVQYAELQGRYKTYHAIQRVLDEFDYVAEAAKENNVSS